MRRRAPYGSHLVKASARCGPVLAREGDRSPPVHWESLRTAHLGFQPFGVTEAHGCT
jgi:hypothetical protein